MPDDILTPWYRFGDGFQRGRVDNNVNADIFNAGHGWDWRVSRLTSEGTISLAVGSTPVGMDRDTALVEAQAAATAALLAAQ